MIYPICFCVSVFFAHMAKRSKKRTNFILFSVLSIAVTVVLAGLRGITVGIDTHNYFEGSWARAMELRNLPLSEYVTAYIAGSRSRFELLFGVLLGISVRMTGSYQTLLTFTHLIIVTCIYIGAFRMKNHAAPELTLLLFYLLYYGQSLNIFRQYIAMAIIFAAVADIENGKHLRYIFFVVIAFLFHNTGVIGLAPLLLHWVLYPKNPLKDTSSLRKAIACVAIVGGAILFVPLVKLLIDSGILSRKYRYYLNGEETSSYRLVFMFLSVEVAAMIIYWKQFHKNNHHSDFYLYSSLSFLALYAMGTNVNHGRRIAAYFAFLNIISIGMLVTSQKKPRNRRLLCLCVVLVVSVYWAYAYYYRNAHGTIPYLLYF